jgi:20S proteasome subunit alpha 6
MYRNQYDTDVTTFSPAGRLHQVEYATEAVKQGSAIIGVRSNQFVVVAALKRSTSELASYHKKIFKVDDHIGIATCGLIGDARTLYKYMISESLNHKFVYEAPLQVGRLVQELSDKSQVFTQRSEKRPYGVGLLVAGYDKTGPHLYQTDPSGNFFEYKAQCIGARSQSAKTYLEKHFESFEDMKLDDLITHALIALKATQQGSRITARNASVGYLSKDIPFTILEDDNIKRFVEQIPDNEGEEKLQSAAVDEDEKDETPDVVEAVGGDASSGGNSSGTGGASSSSSAGAHRPGGMDEDAFE